MYSTSWTSEKDHTTQCSLTFFAQQTISPTQLMAFSELYGSAHCAQGKAQSRKRKPVAELGSMQALGDYLFPCKKLITSPGHVHNYLMHYPNSQVSIHPGLH